MAVNHFRSRPQFHIARNSEPTHKNLHPLGRPLDVASSNRERVGIASLLDARKGNTDRLHSTAYREFYRFALSFPPAPEYRQDGGHDRFTKLNGKHDMRLVIDSVTDNRFVHSH